MTRSGIRNSLSSLNANKDKVQYCTNENKQVRSKTMNTLKLSKYKMGRVTAIDETHKRVFFDSCFMFCGMWYVIYDMNQSSLIGYYNILE